MPAQTLSWQWGAEVRARDQGELLVRGNMGSYGGGGVLVRTRVLVTFALVWGTLVTAQVRNICLSFGNFETISTVKKPLL